jgi:DNA repair protein RadC
MINNLRSKQKKVVDIVSLKEHSLISMRARYTYNPKEFKLVTLRECEVDNPVLDTPGRVVEFWKQHVIESPRYVSDRESFVVFMLNTRRRITGFEVVTIGTLDTLLVHHREVFRPALIAGASAIVVGHNHPSGDPTPSEADIKVTRDLIRAGQLLKVEVLDHIILGVRSAETGREYYSLRELGYFYS